MARDEDKAPTGEALPIDFQMAPAHGGLADLLERRKEAATALSQEEFARQAGINLCLECRRHLTRKDLAAAEDSKRRYCSTCLEWLVLEPFSTISFNDGTTIRFTKQDDGQIFVRVTMDTETPIESTTVLPAAAWATVVKMMSRKRVQ